MGREEGKGYISHSQPAEKTSPGMNGQRAVEVYTIPLSTSIPTVKMYAGWLMYNLSGHTDDTGKILISPTGGMAEDYYMKLTSTLHTDSPENGGCFSNEKKDGSYEYKTTREDTIRPWITYSNHFEDELKNQGWIVFPGIEKMSDGEKERLKLKDYRNYEHRRFFPSDLIKALKLSTTPEECACTIAEMQRIMPYVESLQFIFGDGRKVQGDARYQGKTFDLRISGLENMHESRDKPLILEKEVYSYLPLSGKEFHAPKDWWTSDMTQRIDSVATEFAKTRNFFSRTFVEKDGIYLGIKTANYEYGNKGKKFIPTETMFQQAFEMEEAARAIIEMEHKEHQVQFINKANSLRELLGIPLEGIQHE